MVYVKIGETMIPATVTGVERDRTWDYRHTKSITCAMRYEDAMALFVDDLDWAIVYEGEDTTEVYDNSTFSVAGPITDNRNGTVTVKMGKPTDAELLAIIMGG